MDRAVPCSMVIGASKAPKVGIARGAPIHLHWPFAVHGNLRGPPNGFPCCCEVAVLGALSCPVMTRSLSHNPSNTSLVVPSLMPVLICAGSALPPIKSKSVRQVDRGPHDPQPPAPTHFRPVAVRSW